MRSVMHIYSAVFLVKAEMDLHDGQFLKSHLFQRRDVLPRSDDCSTSSNFLKTSVKLFNLF